IMKKIFEFLFSNILILILLGVILVIILYSLFDEIGAAIGALLAFLGIRLGQKKIRTTIDISGEGTRSPKKDVSKMPFVEPDIPPNTDILESDLCNSCIGHGRCKAEPQLECSYWKGK
ncbi:MAG: hypothetical protein JSW07_13455, partial [bacterium]